MFNVGDIVYRKSDNAEGVIKSVITGDSLVNDYLVQFEKENGVSQGCFKEFDLYSNSINEVEYVNHPKHYSDGKYECIEVMKDVFGKDAVKTFCTLNAFKYTWRAGKKNGLEDLKKASWYLDYASKI